VRDCDAAAGIVKASGGSVYSTGGECMHQMQNGMPFNRAFVRDADGFCSSSCSAAIHEGEATTSLLPAF
jgi:hypothetical protein